jgi:hypothetical protein
LNDTVRPKSGATTPRWGTLARVRYVFEVPGVTFDREWRLGRVLFRPSSVVAKEVLDHDEQTKAHESWALAYTLSTELVARWKGSATVEAEAESLEAAEVSIAEAMAVLRFLIRETVKVNVDVHRVGLVGEVDRAIRDYLVLTDEGRVAPGWRLVESPVSFRFTSQTLDTWDRDGRVDWLSAELAGVLDERSLSGQRVITAINLLDRAFLTRDPTVRVILYAVAVEVLLSDIANEDGSGKTPALRIAGRVAFLTCIAGCASTKAACPYVLGINGERHLWAVAQQFSKIGQWQCSAFLDIARASDMEASFMRPSLFGARNQAVHEGRTSVSDADMRWIRSSSESAVRAFLAWVAETPGRTVSDLDMEMLEGAKRWGTTTPSGAIVDSSPPQDDR